MKKIIVLVSFLMLFGLSGCGSDSPEDVAVQYVKLISNLDINNAIELSSDTYYIELLNTTCASKKAKFLLEETYKLFNSDVFKKEYENSMKSIVFRVIEEIGLEFPYSVQELEKMSNDEQEKVREGIFKGMSESEKKAKMDEFKAKMDDKTFLKNVIAESLYSLKITADNSNEIKELLVKMSSIDGLSRRGFSKYGFELATEVLLEKENNIDNACILEFTFFSDVDDINIIESKSNSADETTVKLEIIYKDETSEKVSINLEKIKEKWKIINPSFYLQKEELLNELNRYKSATFY